MVLQVVSSSFRLHNYAHQLGFSLGKGVCEAIFTFIDMHDDTLPPACDNHEELFPVNEDWQKQHPAANVERISRFIAYMIYQLCLLRALIGGRKRVETSDAVFLLKFVDGLVHDDSTK